MENKICRKIDELGRLVVPIDLRKQYGLKSGDTICFTAHDDGILIHLEDMACDSVEKQDK